MPKAIWNGAVIAEAAENAVQIVEGNVYFPLHAVHQEYLQSSEKITQCQKWLGLLGQVLRFLKWIPCWLRLSTALDADITRDA